ncbi:secreted protein [Candidatus Magnetoovum chiemensis]|nr:secreted protein [Candidatus Magnetoovum chiemensis]
MNLELFLLLAFLLMALLGIFVIPILIQAARMIASVTGIINTFNSSSKELLTEVTQTVRGANSIVNKVDEMVRVLMELTESLKELKTGLKKLGGALKDSDKYLTNLWEQLTNITTVFKKVFTLMINRFTKKGGDTNEQ